jgi:hypothetical protein
MAADLPKEGTFNSTYSAFGTIKVTTIGKERVMFVFDENGLTRSDGFLDHTTTKLERFPIVASRLWVTWILKTCRMGESP